MRLFSEKQCLTFLKSTFLNAGSRCIVRVNGISPDPEKIEAIVNLPAPKNIREVRSFLGMVNQLSKFTEHLADKTKPLRNLLRKKNSWTWGHAQESAFREIKECLISPPVLALYDVNRKTKVSSDTSKYGIGGVVLQEQDDGFWKPFVYFSRVLTNVELHYSPTEKEALGFTWLCERASDYILGKPIIGVTDHKPLLPILMTHCLDQLPPRVQRFRMSLLRFNIELMIHLPGKEMYASDTLLRLLARKSVSKDISKFNEETEAYVVPFWTRSQSRTSNCSKLLKHKIMMKSVRLSSSIVLRTGQRDICSQVPYAPVGQTVHI